MRIRIGVAAFSLTLLAAQVAAAEEVKAPVDPEPGPVERVRLDLGMGISAMGGASGEVMYWPTAQAAIEIHMAGPAWFVAGGHLRYHEYSSGVGGAQLGPIDEGAGGLGGLGGGAFEGRDIDGGGELGVRLETPVFDWLELGGQLMLGASYANSRATGYGEYESVSFGALGALGAHLRPTRFFGMRLGLELLRVGHAWQLAEIDQSRSSSTYAELVAWPTFELTFSF